MVGMKPRNITYANAINYESDPDTDVFYPDIQPHLKLRVFPQAVKGKPQHRKLYYDYYWGSKRGRHCIGQIAEDNKTGITIAKARQIVIGYEARRKNPLSPSHPLGEKQRAFKGITLNSHFDSSFVKDGDIKPVQRKDGTRDGMLPLVFKQQNDRFNRHIRESIGTVPLTQLTTKEIKTWFNEIREGAPSEAIKTLNLAKHIVSHLLKEDENIANVLPNRFGNVDQKKLKQSIELQRKQNINPMEAEEFKAIWSACDKWHNPVEGLFIKFVMASVCRGVSVARIKTSDIETKKGRHQFTALMKKNMITIRFNDELEKIYKEVLKARKEYPQPEDGYLFPRYEYSTTQEDSTKRVVVGVHNKPMDNDCIDRIWKGRSSKLKKGKLVANKNGGIRGIAMEEETSCGKFGLHDIRDTFASFDDITDEEKARLLGHKIGTVAEQSYTKANVNHWQKIADKREELFLRLVS